MSEDPKTMSSDKPDRLPSTVEESRSRIFEFIEQNWERTKDIPCEELEALVIEAVREARTERRRKKRLSN